jgi:lysophospholipase L1-like esterase
MATTIGVGSDRTDWNDDGLNLMRDAVVELQGIANGGSLTAIDDITVQADSDASGVGDIIFKTATTEVARLKRDGTASGLFGRSLPPSGRVMMAMGDSIIANGANDSVSGSVTVTGGRLNEKNWLAWATMLSGGKITYGGLAATGGYTTAQVLATHLPTVLAAKPDACLVLAGTNDTVASTPLATSIANLTSMYAQLLAAGILPIACTLPPRTGATSGDNTLRTQLNIWIVRYARTNGIPMVDFYGTLVDTATAGSYLAALTADGVHPNGAGAKAMGQAMADSMATWLSPVTPFLSQNNTDPALGLSNSLNLTDTNADGVPDNWTISGTGAVGTLVTDAAVKGKYYVATRGSADLTAQMAAAITAAAGDKIYLGVKLMSTVEATSGSFDFGVRINLASGIAAH